MKEKKQEIGIVVPTYNGGEVWRKAANSLKAQRADFDKILIIDSGSSDDTVQIAKEAGFDVVNIQSSEFNHGVTRNLGVHLINCDIVFFLTQDVIPEEKAIKTLSQVFNDSTIAVAYGRQLPHDYANPLARHARLFNYKCDGYVYGIEDSSKHGIKTAFTSNSFAAYRIDYFKEVGEFPTNTIFGEDMFFTAKAILAGYKVAYIPDAIVRHSHNYSPVQEFRRYFDTGVFHCKESWLRKSFGGAESEGLRFVISEFSFLWKNKNLFWIPIALINNFFKILGYKLGVNYQKLPFVMVKCFSMHKKYWNQ
ncbi:MAG: glycosyltransferase [Flavobacteriaceae bacterium]|jgi:rhamnosyltransferase|nr:glycosyltransferase [Flavobacteriaceae bacterium]